ncbi:hypothetical protein GCM10022254_60520 [Actinomadura meridiana]|uniref:G domain-containing protein n=1 Tax=Actinomadura meridiana TaxID=559626 RepID=A0ABP8CJ06_9ACTN
MEADDTESLRPLAATTFLPGLWETDAEPSDCARNLSFQREEPALPLPLIIGGVVLASGAIGTAVTVRQLRRPAKIILLGASKSGKTTLLNTWQGKWDEPVTRTLPAGEFIGKIQLDTGKKILSVDKPITFRNVRDFSGMDEILENSKDGVKAASYILYLIKAPNLEADEDTLKESEFYERLIADASRIKRYGAKVKRVIFVVTFTDQDSRYDPQDPADFLSTVQKQLSEPINILEMETTKVVAGSMLTLESAELLAADVIQAML